MANQKENIEDDKSANATAPKVINYTRTQLMEFSRNKASNELPKVFDFSGADEKRKEKLRHVLKNRNISQMFHQKNGGSNGSEDGVNAQSEQTRSSFQQMISNAVTLAQQKNSEYTAYTAASRRRIGSGRILPDSEPEEPEWANCGPISKHDIIELHGFDGPEDDATQKSEDASVAPPARSTPSKSGNGTKKSGKSDYHFNFEDFLKLDIPASVSCPRDPGASGKSRSSQWFGNDKVQNPSKFPYNMHEPKSTPQQFFDHHQKASQKKANATKKLRSVDELEANWHSWLGHEKVIDPNANNANSYAAADNAIRLMLAQLAQTQRPAPTTAQSNFFQNLMNQGASSFQHRMSQSALMERPDAQLLLHRLVNGEISQFHLLQQISNPNLHQRDRETLLGVFKFCNDNQQWLIQQQEQQLKHKQQMSQQLRLLQIIQMKNANMQSQPQMHSHSQQAFLQNSIYKKQFEDLQRFKTNQSPKFNKFPSYKGTQQSMPNQSNSRFNHRGYY